MSMKFILLINVKMPIGIVGVLTLMSRINGLNLKFQLLAF